jgi:hypothetical protein
VVLGLLRVLGCWIAYCLGRLLAPASGGDQVWNLGAGAGDADARIIRVNQEVQKGGGAGNG